MKKYWSLKFKIWLSLSIIWLIFACYASPVVKYAWEYHFDYDNINNEFIERQSQQIKAKEKYAKEAEARDKYAEINRKIQIKEKEYVTDLINSENSNLEDLESTKKEIEFLKSGKAELEQNFGKALYRIASFYEGIIIIEESIEKPDYIMLFCNIFMPSLIFLAGWLFLYYGYLILKTYFYSTPFVLAETSVTAFQRFVAGLVSVILFIDQIFRYFDDNQFSGITFAMATILFLFAIHGLSLKRGQIYLEKNFFYK